MTYLAQRIEQASAEQQRELLYAAFKPIFPEVSAGAWDAIDEWNTHYDRFTAMLDVQAWLSAAEMLCPHNMNLSVERRLGKGMRPAYAAIWSVDAGDMDVHFNGWGATPALALAAAALRAHISENPDAG